MPYQLGIDLGTTFTGAAVNRGGRVEMVPLGNRATVIPSVVFLRQDETILTGEAANRRGLTEPDRVAREFKRRIGDPAPLILGGVPYSAERLAAKLLRWTADAVAEREGGPPDAIALTYPANWGSYKQDLLRQSIRLADLDGVVTLTEPEAAATSYSSTERVDPGDVVAVYDLGGGTFDACVLRKTETGFEILGQPEGIERLGGIDFDEAVFVHVTRALGGAVEQLDPEDPAAVAAVARLRQDCVEAKEALSGDTDVSIPVILPNVRTEIRMTRSEFEGMVRPAIAETIDALRRALRSAKVEPNDVRAVLLVGGSSRIPLVAQMVSAGLGRPVAVDAHPKHAVALGAAIAAGEKAADEPAQPEALPTAEATVEEAAEAAPDEVPAEAAQPAGPRSVAVGESVALPPPSPPPAKRGAGGLAKVAVPLLVAAGVGAFLLLRSKGHGTAGTHPTPSPSISASVSAAPTGATAWTRVQLAGAVAGGARNQHMNRIVSGPPGFLAVGADESGGDSDAAVWTSPNGTAWTRVPKDPNDLGGPGSQEMNMVVLAAPGLVAVGWDGRSGNLDAAVWTSSDGTKWARVRDASFGGPGDQWMNRVALLGSELVAVGIDSAKGYAAVWTSNDATHWTRVADQPALSGPGSLRMRGVTAGGPGLVAVGFVTQGKETDAAAWTSVDGAHWSRVSGASLGGPGAQVMATVVKGGPGFVAVGSNGSDAAVWTSADGTSWSRVAAPALGGAGDQEATYVVNEAGLLVAVGSTTTGGSKSPAAWTSPDGVHWSRQSVPGTGEMNGAVAVQNGVVGVGQTTGGESDAAVWVLAARP